MSHMTDQRDKSLQAGDRFRRARLDQVKEVATVVATRTDAFGIPHVRFTIRFELPSGRATETERSLSLSSFVGRYSELVG